MCNKYRGHHRNNVPWCPHKLYQLTHTIHISIHAQLCETLVLYQSPSLFPFRTISERFHLINDPTVTVYIPLDEGAEWVAHLRAGEHSRDLYRQLGQYGVSVYPQHLEALDRAGALVRLEDGSVILTDLTLYSNSTGLSLAADSGKGLFV